MFDRGYPALDFCKEINDLGMTFIMRLRSKFNLDIDAMGAGCHDYVFKDDQGSNLKVRVIKLKLDNGIIETLITNIFDYRIGEKLFKELYNLRWPVETEYEILKNKLEIENFSSIKINGVLQDFYVSLFVSNIISIAAKNAQIIINKQHENKNNKHNYKVNKNHAVGTYKDNFISVLLDNCLISRAKKIARILSLLTKRLIAIKPSRSNPRNKLRTTLKYPNNRKSNC
jgi:hypothetical protein